MIAIPQVLRPILVKKHRHRNALKALEALIGAAVKSELPVTPA
jgi:hypothetical protein